jgi:hypothetical protein
MAQKRAAPRAFPCFCKNLLFFVTDFYTIEKHFGVPHDKTIFFGDRIRLAHFLSLVLKPLFCYTFLH